MNPEHQALARQLLALALAVIEDATEAAIAGQATQLDPTTCRHSADQLAQTAEVLAALATLARYLADTNLNTASDNQA